MELTGINITRAQFAKDYSIIKGEGIVQGIKASGQNNEWVNPNIMQSPKAGEYERTILVNLKAIEMRKVNRVKALFEGRDSIDLAELKGLTVVHNINLNKGQASPRLPMRNQEITLRFENAFVKATGEMYTDESGQQVLNSFDMQVPEPVFADSFDFSDVPTEEVRPAVSFGDAEKVFESASQAQ